MFLFLAADWVVCDVSWRWLTVRELQKTAKGGATARLTDVKGYTGAHKERFDAETGKGKGKEGRADVTRNTGYVGNYKNDGTYGGGKKSSSSSGKKK